MIGIWSDLLLFSCVAAFVTGIVLAAASLVVTERRIDGSDGSRPSAYRAQKSRRECMTAAGFCFWLPAAAKNSTPKKCRTYLERKRRYVVCLE